ncbi:MAG: CoA-binding protein [bacterium]
MVQACELPLNNATTTEIKNILDHYHTVAIIGISNNEEKASYQVAEYLQRHGFTIYPVNPRYQEILGIACHPTLLEIPVPIEIVDIFRKPSAIDEIVTQAIRKKAKVIWMQSGIVNNKAAQTARDAGLTVVMDRCMMVEHRRLHGNPGP